MTLGYRIFTLRGSLGLSQEAFGELLDTTRQTVSRWETDECIPTIDKIVQMSRLFSVTTDSLLVDGITTFDPPSDAYPCGVYRSPTCEIVETEKFALAFRHLRQENVFRAELYRGFRAQKQLAAVCSHDFSTGEGTFAFRWDNTSGSDSDALREMLGQPFDSSLLRQMNRTERFHTAPFDSPLPTVREAGVSGCLRSWRMTSRVVSLADCLEWYLCTPLTEYAFRVQSNPRNHYCCAMSYEVCDLGIRYGRQHLRIRHYADDREPFCHSHCDFAEGTALPFNPLISADDDSLVRVKHYTDDEIVLSENDDTFPYRRNYDFEERFCAD